MQHEMCVFKTIDKNGVRSNLQKIRQKKKNVYVPNIIKVSINRLINSNVNNIFNSPNNCSKFDNDLGYGLFGVGAQ